MVIDSSGLVIGIPKVYITSAGLRVLVFRA